MLQQACSRHVIQFSISMVFRMCVDFPLMINSLSPLFVCGDLVRVSEGGPRQRPRVPTQHAVTQRLQVTASRWSWVDTHTYDNICFPIFTLTKHHHKTNLRCTYKPVLYGFHDETSQMLKEPFIQSASQEKKNLLSGASACAWRLCKTDGLWEEVNLAAAYRVKWHVICCR